MPKPWSGSATICACRQPGACRRRSTRADADLRLHACAARRGRWPPGAASEAWRQRSLAALDDELRRRGSRLRVLRRAEPETLQTSDRGLQCGSGILEPPLRAGHRASRRHHQAGLRRQGVRAESFNGCAAVRALGTARRGQGDPYRVFTPFWRAALAKWRSAESTTRRFACRGRRGPDGMPLETLGRRPAGDGTAASGRRGRGRKRAREALEIFLDGALSGYARAAIAPTVSARRGCRRTCTSARSRRGASGSAMKARAAPADTAESGGLLARTRLARVRAPPAAPLPAHARAATSTRASTASTGPTRARRRCRAWQRGRTGYPIVDAGMRELWHTGWMHNRVRMIVASFLVKHLRLPWQDGARWFWDTLVDADLANNTLGWQWVAGCGADAAPYFRIFNPVTAGAEVRSRRRLRRALGARARRAADCPRASRHGPHPELAATLAPGYPPLAHRRSCRGPRRRPRRLSPPALRHAPN